jgi:hypothetical protein
MGPIHNLDNLVVTGPSESGHSGRKAGVPTGEDQAQLATVPLSAQVEQIHATDASSFQAVLNDAIHKLRVAASETLDPAESGYLSGMANRFQQLAEASNEGNLSSPVGNP